MVKIVALAAAAVVGEKPPVEANGGNGVNVTNCSDGKLSFNALPTFIEAESN